MNKEGAKGFASGSWVQVKVKSPIVVVATMINQSFLDGLKRIDTS